MGASQTKAAAADAALLLPGIDLPNSAEYTAQQVAQHNKFDDCWIVLHGFVFDVTAFLHEHPGGAHLISAFAGRDATGEFVANGHSQRAHSLLVDFFRGRLRVGAAPAATSAPLSATDASPPAVHAATTVPAASASGATSLTNAPASSSSASLPVSSFSFSSSSSTPSTASASAATANTGTALKVLYATQKGTARKYAEQIVEQALRSGAVSSAAAVDLKSYEPEDLAGESALVVFVLSTYTDGQPTDSGKFFCAWLEDACTDFRVHKGFLSRVRYTVFGLGNSIYEENFNKVALTVDQWLQDGGAARIVACGVGDENVARGDATGSQEKDFQAWLRQCVPALAVAAASVSASATAVPPSGAAAGCCQSSSSAAGACSCSAPALSREREDEIRQDLAAEEAAEAAAGSRLAPREPLIDLEDMGPLMSVATGDAQRGRGTRRGGKKSAAATAAAAATMAVGESVEVSGARHHDGDDGGDDDDDDDQVSGASASVAPLREMVTDEIRQSLTKQGYKIIGSHSGVKLCRWTKAMLRGRGGCYKHTCYGITSYACMEMTPSLACANKCVFCWRHHSNPVGKEWKWQLDEPEFLIEQAIAQHGAMIRQMKGVPGVKVERLADAATIRHCALSLVGEPIMYPHINRFIDMLHERRISTFLVTNAQFPDRIRDLKPVTQLYVSVDASTPESLKAVDRPLFKDYWERFLASLEAMGQKQTRTVYRLTLIKAWNMEEIANYASLIARGVPEFIEIKGVTFCGSSDASSLTMKNVPFHHEVLYFAQELLKYIAEDYEIACEHAHSCMIVIAHKKFRVDGAWHTWIDYDKFHALVAAGRPFTSLEYAARTPDWAVWGAKEAGFDPAEERVYVKGAKKRELSLAGGGGGADNASQAGVDEQQDPFALDVDAVNGGC